MVLNDSTVNGVTFESNALIIRNSTENDRGSYRCLLKNYAGEIISPAVMVDIYSKFLMYFCPSTIAINNIVT